MANPEETDLTMDPTSLFREEVYTDQRLGTIRQMTPVTADGAPDPSRTMLFVGQAHIVTPAGTLPISFEIAANKLSEAVAAFGDAAKVAIEDTVNELQDLRRQASSGLVVPEPGMASSILGPGGVPAGAGPKLR